ncbi:MAG: methyltransferase domain-containing protein, partial [Chloroflexi bacterium]|nr:methyltransferase domain-containing protein [Chloroflexota bacterium]
MDTCPVCSWDFSTGEFKVIPYPSGTRPKIAGQVPTTIRFCGRCGVGLACPPISGEATEGLYSQGEYWKQTQSGVSLRILPVPFALAQARWRLIEGSVAEHAGSRAIRVLDIGAGHGYLGLVAAAKGSVRLGEYCAVEPDPTMRQYLNHMWASRGCKATLVTLPSLDDVTGSCDAVVLSHVLEHVDAPLSFVESAAGCLSREGVLFVDVPNQDHLFKRDVFPHAIFFSVQSLGLLLERAGLESLSIGVWGRDMYGSPLCDRAPVTRKLVGKAIGVSSKALPVGLSVRVYSWYFGMG